MQARARRRRPRAFIVALAGILLLAGAVGILAAGSFSAPAFNKKGGKKHITMDHIFNGTFAPKTKAVAWVKEGERELDVNWKDFRIYILRWHATHLRSG
jgi:dipeptidyl aminopeptidase